MAVLGSQRLLQGATSGRSGSRRPPVPVLSGAAPCCSGRLPGPAAGPSVSKTVHWSAATPCLAQGGVCRAAAAESATAAQHLSQLQIKAIINGQGTIFPEAEPGSKAWVYAIFDDKQKLQYVGFSADLRNSLRTVLSRRPDKAYFYKALHLPEMDQAAMVAVRDEWFVEVGGPPPGNKLALERAQWQQPVDAGAISQRGKQGAAEEKSRQLLDAIKARGCKEEFKANPAMLAEGLVDFLPAREVTEEELQAQRNAAAELARQKRTCKAIVDGATKEFQVLFQRNFKTKGGCMIDCQCTFDGKDTMHRIIVGKPYYEPFGIEPEAVVAVALALLLQHKLPLHPGDSILGSSTFPAKYFAVSEMEQWFGEEFADLYTRLTGHAWDSDISKFWRFNRVEDYGPLRLENMESMQIAIGKYD